MTGEPHVIDIYFLRIQILQLNRIFRESETVCTIPAFGNGKKGFPVAPFDPGDQTVFVVMIDGTRVEDRVDAQPLLKIRIGLRVQIISPGERNMITCQDRIFISVKDPVIEICFPSRRSCSAFSSKYFGCIVRFTSMSSFLPVDIFGFSYVLSANISSSHKSDLLSIVLFQAFPKPAKFLQLFLRYTGIIAMSSEDSHVFQLQIIQKISPVREHRSVIHIRITGA